MTTRIPIVVGNWKLHKTVSESVATTDALVDLLPKRGRAEIAVAPVFTALMGVAAQLKGSRVALGAQDLHWEAKGAFTGEVGPLQLVDVGCAFVIIGHSERREYFAETDERVARKVRSALDHGLKPIVCVGESLQTREAGDAEPHVVAQVDAARQGVQPADLASLVIAYDPIWAIGTGRTASPADAEQMHAAVRAQVQRSHGVPAGEGLRILYGGSVKPENAGELMLQPNIDGALVGGASLDAASFAAIVAAAD